MLSKIVLQSSTHCYSNTNGECVLQVIIKCCSCFSMRATLARCTPRDRRLRQGRRTATLLSHDKETLSQTSVHVSFQERINTERSEFQHFDTMASVSFNLNTLERQLCLADRCVHHNTLNTNCATCNHPHCTSKVHSTSMYCEQNASEFGFLLEPSIERQPDASTGATSKNSHLSCSPRCLCVHHSERRNSVLFSNMFSGTATGLPWQTCCPRSHKAAFRLPRHPHAAIENS